MLMTGKTPEMAEDAAQITARDIARLLTMSIRTIWRLVELGLFPQPIRYTRKLVRWDRETVLAWIKKKAKEAAHADGLVG